MGSMQDWKGNENSIFKALGASNHTLEEREEHDFYATDPIAVDKLLEHEQLESKLWEPACGEGHLSKRLKKFGFQVYSTDLINRGFGEGGGQLPRTDNILSRKHYYKSSVSICYRVYFKVFRVGWRWTSCLHVPETHSFRGSRTIQ